MQFIEKFCIATFPVADYKSNKSMIDVIQYTTKGKVMLFTSNYQRAIKLIETATPDNFKQVRFYQDLQKVLDSADSWTEQKQNEFIEKMLSRFEGMAGWYFISAEDPQNIFDLTQAGQTTLDCFTFVTQKLPNVEQSYRLQFILKEVMRIKSRQNAPIYDLNQKPTTHFQDGALKLAVIKQLMFEEGKLKPELDRQLFIEESLRFLDPDEPGKVEFEISQYLLKLDIPKYLLNQIKTLVITENHLWLKKITCFLSRYSLSVGEKAINDLALLPNLEEIIIEDNESEKEIKKTQVAIADTYTNTMEGNLIEIELNYEDEISLPESDDIWELIFRLSSCPYETKQSSENTLLSKAFVRALEERNIRITKKPRRDLVRSYSSSLGFYW